MSGSVAVTGAPMAVSISVFSAMVRITASVANTGARLGSIASSRINTVNFVSSFPVPLSMASAAFSGTVNVTAPVFNALSVAVYFLPSPSSCHPVIVTSVRKSYMPRSDCSKPVTGWPKSMISSKVPGVTV